MPTTSKRRASANRANAAKSTGPRTPEGKERSARNSRKHGFAAARFAVAGVDDLDVVANLRADAIAVYQPVNSQELFAVERIALAQQALLRCAALEAGLHALAMNESIAADGGQLNRMADDLGREGPVARLQNRSLCLAVGFQRICARNESWKLFLRYQSQTERLFRRAVEDFERLKGLRAELPNEPITDLDPDPAPDSDLLPPTPPLTDEDIARRYAARFDPTVALPSGFSTRRE